MDKAPVRFSTFVTLMSTGVMYHSSTMTEYLADVIPRLEEYIKLRTTMMETPPTLPEPAAESSAAVGASTATEAGQTKSKADSNEDVREEEPSTPKTPPRQLRRVSSRSRSPTKRSRLGRTASSLKAIPDSPNPAPPRPKTPPTARSILSSVGILLEDAVHSSQEKVNLAQAAYDSVGISCVHLSSSWTDTSSVS